MSDYTLTKRELTALKAKLTHAQRSDDRGKVFKACSEAYAVFDAKGWPDCWSMWQRARDDAQEGSTFGERYGHFLGAVPLDND